MDTKFPLLLNHPDAYAVFRQIVDELPAGVEVYLVGGAIRNALSLHHFGERMRQRDYDQIATKGSQKYLDFLRSKGFLEGGIVRDDQTILYKGLVPNPDRHGYDDSVVFDIHPVDGMTVIDNLAGNVGLTINGSALSLRDIFSEYWPSRVIELPGAKEDIRAKRLRVNRAGYRSQPAFFFSVLRFMSAGFAPPPRDEIKLLLDELPKLVSEHFERNVAKVYNYTGGEAEARRLAESIGIKGDVFSEQTVKSGGVSIDLAG